MEIAELKAQQINFDLQVGTYDPTLAKYSITRAYKLEQQQKQPEKKVTPFKDIWEFYLKASLISESTRLKVIQYITRDLANWYSPSDSIITFLEKGKYKESTRLERARYIYAALNLWGKRKGQEYPETRQVKDYLSEIKRMDAKRRRQTSPQGYEDWEIKVILEEIKTINPKYWYYFYFLASTGMRPGEVVALTWGDIRHSSNGSKFYVSVNKAVNCQQVKETKTGKARIVPIDSELIRTLHEMSGSNPVEDITRLVFTDDSGEHVSHIYATRQVWNKAVNKLIDEGVIDRRLKPYSLRRAYITRLIRSGLDPATVAEIAGNSSEIIHRNYLFSQDVLAVSIPTLKIEDES